MEFAVKWMYSVDVELEMPYQDNLQSLMNVGEYRQIVGSDIWKRMDYIRRCGNNVAHSNRKLGKDEAMLCLENLYIFLDYVAYCYAKEYEERDFNPTLITLRAKKAKESKEADLSFFPGCVLLPHGKLKKSLLQRSALLPQSPRLL